jgi:hypothetical protein
MDRTPRAAGFAAGSGEDSAPAGTGHTVFLALLPCFALTLLLGFLSDGAYHDDDLAHFLIARWARWFPEYLLHIWGRPGATIPLAAVAWIGDAETGWHVARALSAGVTAAASLVAAGVARRLGLRHAWLVVLLCYLQPLNAMLAGTSLTENFAALYLVAAVALLLRGRVVAASVGFSAVLVSRHETLVLLPVWWLALAATHGRVRPRLLAGIISLWAPVLHNLLFRLLFQRWPVEAFFQPRGSTEYLPTEPLAYVPYALEAVPAVIAGLAIIGGADLVRRRPLIPALAGMFFLTHGAIRALGVFASGGYGRFMVTVAPLVAILAAVGLEDFAARVRQGRSARGHWLVFGAVWLIGLVAFEVERHAGRIAIGDGWSVWAMRGATAVVLTVLAAAWATPRKRAGMMLKTAAAVLALTCTVQWACIVRPLRLRPDVLAVRRVVTWLDESGMLDAPIFAPNPWFAYFLGLVEYPRAHKDARLLASMPVGAIVIWDSTYSGSDFHSLALARLLNSGEYRLLRKFAGEGPGAIELYVFRKVVETPVPTDSAPSYPIDLISVESPHVGVYYFRPGGTNAGQE